MKVKVRATAVYEWEEDSENWKEENPQTKEELIELAQKYADDDPEYILNSEIASISKIEEIQ